MKELKKKEGPNGQNVVQFLIHHWKRASFETDSVFQVEKYANDPLNWHEGVKARFGVAFLDAMYDIQNRISKLTVLYLLIHGDNDQLVKIDSSNFLHKNSSSTDKTYKVHA